MTSLNQKIKARDAFSLFSLFYVACFCCLFCVVDLFLICLFIIAVSADRQTEIGDWKLESWTLGSVEDCCFCL